MGLGACAFVPLREKTPNGVPTAEPPAPLPATPSAAAVPHETPPRHERRARRQATPPPVPKRVVVLLPDGDSSFESTLPALENELTARGFEVQSLEGDKAATAFPPAKTGQVTYAVAVGSKAAVIGARLHLPTVYCQVASALPPVPGAADLHGVAALPPLALQLRAWKELSPRLARVALILGPGHEATAVEARRAAAELSISLVYRVASSDQEAVYVFKRLAPEVDGLWMLPDNDVLSPRAIKAMLGEASRHKVESLVFTPGLLDWGGLLSVSSTSQDLASTVADVVDRMATHPDSVPPLTPLSELEIEVNETAAARFGISAPSRSWIVGPRTW